MLPAVTLAGVVGNESGLQSSVTVPGAYTAEGLEAGPSGFLRELGTIRTDAALRAAFGSEPPDLGAELLALLPAGLCQGLDRVSSPTSTCGRISIRWPPRRSWSGPPARNRPILGVLREASKNTEFGGDGGELRPVTEAFEPVHEFFRAPGKGALRRIKGKVNPDKAPADEYVALLGALKGGFAAIAQTPDPSGAKEVLDIEGWVETRLPGGDPVTDELARFLRVPVHVVKGTVRQGRGKGVSTAWSTVVERVPAEPGRPLSRGGRRQRRGAGRLRGVLRAQRHLLDLLPREPGQGDLRGRQRGPRSERADRAGVQELPGPRAAHPPGPLLRAARERVSRSPCARVSPSARPTRGSCRARRGWRSGAMPWSISSGRRPGGSSSWPGPNAAQGAAVRLTASNASGQPVEAEGVWGFFRILDRARIRRGAGNSLTLSWTVQTDKGDVEIPYDVGDLPAVHPLESGFLRFSCPSRITTGAP